MDDEDRPTEGDNIPWEYREFQRLASEGGEKAKKKLGPGLDDCMETCTELAAYACPMLITANAALTRDLVREVIEKYMDRPIRDKDTGKEIPPSIAKAIVRYLLSRLSPAQQRACIPMTTQMWSTAELVEYQLAHDMWESDSLEPSVTDFHQHILELRHGGPGDSEGVDVTMTGIDAGKKLWDEEKAKIRQRQTENDEARALLHAEVEAQLLGRSVDEYRNNKKFDKQQREYQANTSKIMRAFRTICKSIRPVVWEDESPDGSVAVKMNGRWHVTTESHARYMGLALATKGGR